VFSGTKLGFHTDELGIVTSVTDGRTPQTGNLREGDIIEGLSSTTTGRVNFMDKIQAIQKGSERVPQTDDRIYPAPSKGYR